MKQAILITAYKNIEQLNDLLDAFDYRFVFYIHIDKKSNICKDDINKLKSRERVLFVSQEYSINWGGVNHLKAILALLREAIKDEETTYFHLITGQDYPIKTPQQMVSFMEAHNGKEFMEYNKLPYANWPHGGTDRIDHYNLNDHLYGRDGFGRFVIMSFLAIQRRLGLKRKYPNNFPKTIYGGSTYWSLSWQCINYVFKYMEENPEYLERFEYSFCSEEIFFQTIILNSPFANMVENSNLRYIDWTERNNSFPANLDNSDLKPILESDSLFARKFEKPYSDALLMDIKSTLSKQT